MSAAPSPADWRVGLLSAADAGGVVATTEALALRQPGVEGARLLWELGSLGPWRDPRPSPAPAVLSLADLALLGAEPRLSADGRLAALPLRAGFTAATAPAVTAKPGCSLRR